MRRERLDQRIGVVRSHVRVGDHGKAVCGSNSDDLRREAVAQRRRNTDAVRARVDRADDFLHGVRHHATR